jgi:hypothetical protein
MKFSGPGRGLRVTAEWLGLGLFCPAPSPRFRHRFARHKAPEKLHRIGIQRPGNGDKFDQVDPPLAALIFGDEGLWPAEFASQNLLADPGFMSHCGKKLDQALMFVRSKGFLH